MASHLTGIDHAVIVVKDLTRAAERYRQLGFTLSPRGQHSAHMGTANYTIMLQQDYFELLGVLTATPNNQRWRNGLAQGEGAKAMALSTDDADLAQAEIRGLGLAAGEVMAFSRPVERPDGSRTEARFRVTEFAEDAVPGLSLFVCGQLTREAVWLPELMSHANTAQGIADIVVAVGDLQAADRAWRRIVGPKAMMPADGGVAVAIGRHRLTLLSPEAVAARFPGSALPLSHGDGMVALSFTVGEIAAARACLKRAAIGFVESPRSLAVAPAEAHGVLIEFRAP